MRNLWGYHQTLGLGYFEQTIDTGNMVLLILNFFSKVTPEVSDVTDDDKELDIKF